MKEQGNALSEKIATTREECSKDKNFKVKWKKEQNIKKLRRREAFEWGGEKNPIRAAGVKQLAKGKLVSSKNSDKTLTKDLVI